MKRKWLIKPYTDQVHYLSQELGICAVTAHLLLNRGIDSVEKAQRFLNGEYSHSHPPELLPDMEKAIMRISTALANKESITIYGDYDVDGQTAVALLVEVLRSLAADPDLIHYYIPNRMVEGYGLHCDALKNISQVSSLVITVDCGIASIEAARYARSLGLDLIITDHHEPGSELPEAIAVINPKRSDSRYPFPYLAGVGVAFKLVQALGSLYGKDYRHWLDLVALGTVADLVPLVDENRIFVKLGLQQLENTASLGLKALAQICALKAPYKAADLGFKLGPRLNAVGRMGESQRGVELLLSSDWQHAQRMAEILDQENRLRQQTESDILAEAVAMIETNGWHQDPVIVAASEHWHPGVIGIVASRIVERYYRPTIIIAIENGIGRGSARSIAGFNLYTGLSQVKHLLLEFGGHEMAAGLSVAAENITLLRQAFSEVVSSSLKPEDFVPKLQIDCEVDISEMTPQLLAELALLEPYGMGNPTPVLKVTGSVISTRAMGADGEHLRCQIQDSFGHIIEAVGFGMYQAMQEENARERLSFAVYPQPGYYDSHSVELVVRDFRAEPESDNYITDWMFKRFPWQLPRQFDQVSHWHNAFGNIPGLSEYNVYNIIDCRNVWDKIGKLKKILDPSKRVMIYAASPARVLNLCRQLRIAIPNGYSFIGFEHELLTQSERAELVTLLTQKRIRWVVTTGIWQSKHQWDQVVVCDPFCEPGLWYNLCDQVSDGGELVLLYGKEDCNWMQCKIRANFPDREDLARFYLALTRKGQTELTYEQVAALAQPLALGDCVETMLDIFTELGLIAKNEQSVKIMPKPACKLDLTSSVRYNNGIIKRKQYLTYLQDCLERGFIDGLKSENSCN